MSRLSIYYGRISYVEPQPGQETFFPRKEPLRDAIEAARSVERYGHLWVLGNLLFEDDQHLIRGRLGYPQTDEITQQDYDDDAHQFVAKTFNVPDAASSGFVLDYWSGLIAFESGAKIRPTGFVNHLVALLNSTGIGAFRGELVRLAETYREFLRKADKITKVAFEVRPTNPGDREIFRPLDEGMKAGNALRYRGVVENQEDGLTVNPPESYDEPSRNPAVQGIAMVDEGYGDHFRIDGEYQGQPVRFDSRTGGLLNDLLEDAPDDPEARTEVLAERLGERANLVEPGQETPDLVEVRDDQDDDADADAFEDEPSEDL